MLVPLVAAAVALAALDASASPERTRAPTAEGAHGSEPSPEPDPPAALARPEPDATPPPPDTTPPEPDATVSESEPRPLRAPRFAEPQRVPPRDASPTERPRERYQARPPLLRPALRVAPGFSARVTGRPIAAFSLDVLASLMVGLHPGRRQLGLAPELGYSLRAPGVDHDLLGGLGLVYGINAEGPTFGVLPRFVTALGPDGTGFGTRTGLWWDFAENGFSIELSHQWVRFAGGDTHELRVTLGLDVLMLVVVLTDARMEWL